MLFVFTFGEVICDRHELVNDDERDAEARTKCNDLLNDGVAESVGTLRFVVQNFGHGRVGNDVAGTFDDVFVEVTYEAVRDV